MGFLNRLFSGSSKKQQPAITPPTSFIECMDIVRNWSAQAAIDPDFDMNDKQLHLALETYVTCPYCSSSIKFGNAISFQGTKLEVQCPSCHTIPRKEKNYEYSATQL